MKPFVNGILLPSFITKSFILILFFNLPLTTVELLSQGDRNWVKTSFVDSSTVYFLKNINDTIYAGSQRGLFRSTDNGGSWDTVHHFSYVSSFAKHGNKYYSSSYHYGIQESTDLINWVDASQGAPHNITSLLSTDRGLLMATNDGIFKLDSLTGAWVSDSLIIKSLHNDYIWDLLQNENKIFAVGSNHIYTFDMAVTQWHKVAGNFEFEGVRCKLINDTLLISTSGGGMLSVSESDDSVQVYSGPEDLSEEFYIRDFDTLNRSIVYLSGNNIKLADTINDDICNTLLTALLVIENNILVGTDGNGIWKLETDSLFIRSATVESDVAVIPNPSSGSFTINLSLQPLTKYSLTIVNSQGGILNSKSIETSLLKEDVSLSFDIFGPGLYYVQLACKNESIIKEIVIQ